MFLLLFNVLTLVTNFPNLPFSLENYGGHSIGVAAAAVLPLQDSISWSKEAQWTELNDLFTLDWPNHLPIFFILAFLNLFLWALSQMDIQNKSSSISVAYPVG